MRADVNVSVRPYGSEEFGTRTEMKNLNSFKAITRAIENEVDRQIDLIESGEKVIQETRRWDDIKGYSYPMRSKEDAMDYRYFPEPDLGPISVKEEWITEIKNNQPELAQEKRERYIKEYSLPEYDATQLTSEKSLADLFEKILETGANPKKVSNYLMGETMRLLKEQEKEVDDINFSPKHLGTLIKLQEEGKINSNVAKEIFEHIFNEDIDPEVYVKEHGLQMESNEDELKDIIKKVIDDNPKSVEDYNNGKEKAIGFLVGQTMKLTKGKANPGMVNKLLKEMLSN